LRLAADEHSERDQVVAPDRVVLEGDVVVATPGSVEIDLGGADDAAFHGSHGRIETFGTRTAKYGSKPSMFARTGCTVGITPNGIAITWSNTRAWARAKAARRSSSVAPRLMSLKAAMNASSDWLFGGLCTLVGLARLRSDCAPPCANTDVQPV